MLVILYTDSRDMLVLLSTVTSRYYICCTDGSIVSKGYGIKENGMGGICSTDIQKKSSLWNHRLKWIDCG
jgi:hypothetical protein